MTELILYGTLGLLLLAVVTKLLLSARAAPTTGRGEPVEFFPRHCRYFPQMRQVFSPEDASFLKERSSRPLLRRWKADRRSAARLYLQSLREDFSGLHRLWRTLARYSAQLEPRQQASVAWVSLRFQLLFLAAEVQILAGLPAGAELQRMAWLVGNMSGRLEKAALTLDSDSGTLTP